MIKEFPDYMPISLSLKNEIEAITRQYPPYADFSFVNLHSWNNDGSGAVALLNENLVLHYPSYVDDSHFLTFLGDNAVPATAQTLLDAAESKGDNSQLQIVPHIGAAALDGDKQIRATEDPDNHDYVISLSKLVAAGGRRLRRFRRAVHSFDRQNGQTAELVELNLTDQPTQQQVMDVFTGRESQKPTNESVYEAQAVWRLLQESEHYQLHSYGLAVGSELRAFIIAEDVGNGWSIGHFWKADIAYRGIYPYLMQRVAEALKQEGVELMNIQADLGIAGLRFFKSIFDPVDQLKKYTVERLRA